MAKEVIRVEQVSKLYRLGEIGTGTLSKDLNRWWARMRGKEDPYTRLGQLNDRTRKGSFGDIVWALRDINFSLEQGKILGVIGQNGAGKSTLLKIISQITTPSEGSLKIRGRIASLLEVGTGFHPEMTGRENIFMNGTLLGMTRREIQSKLDNIIDFAGVALYIDTPVKRYSSGMQVRLAFAVAAFLEPEILIVDEVLAVGDAEFQKRAIGRMQEVSAGDGRTVLFVSHNMTAVSSLCSEAIVLENGSVVCHDSVEKSIDFYLHNIEKNRSMVRWDIEKRPGDDVASLISARLVGSDDQEAKKVEFAQDFGIEYTFEVLNSGFRLYPNVHFLTKRNDYLFVSPHQQPITSKGIYTVRLDVPGNLLNDGGYIAGIALTSTNPTRVHFFSSDALIFDVVEKDYNEREGEYLDKIPGFFRPTLNWNVTKIS
jgi:lipopolysaccharide transport system ATP-binding protein